MVVSENARTIIDVDNNNWNFGRSFIKGDTVTYVRHSKADKDYYVVSKGGQQFYIYRTYLIDLDNFVAKQAEEQRQSLDALHAQKRFVISSTTSLKSEKPEFEFKIGDTVTIMDARPYETWATLMISKGDAKGTIFSQFVKLTPTLQGKIDEMVDKYNQEMAKRQERENKEAQVKRAKALRAKYGTEIANRLLKGQIWIGMTSDMAIDCIGSPNKVNRTVDASGTFDQWVYSDRYLYFHNGKLKSWQESL